MSDASDKLMDVVLHSCPGKKVSDGVMPAGRHLMTCKCGVEWFFSEAEWDLVREVAKQMISAKEKRVLLTDKGRVEP